jgi:hypothetical protein
MKFSAYVDSCIVEERVILGLTLRPLSIGHYLWGKKLECGFFNDEENAQVTVEDLLAGLLICSMTFGEFAEFIESPDSTQEITRWGRQVKKLCKNDKAFNIFLKIKEFEDYVRKGSEMPKFSVNNQNSGKSGAHWAMSLIHVLTSKLNYSRDEALNMPLKLAFAEYCKYAETENAITLLNPIEEEIVGGNFDWEEYLKKKV